jgi:hypothetical protein
LLVERPYSGCNACAVVVDQRVAGHEVAGDMNFVNGVRRKRLQRVERVESKLPRLRRWLTSRRDAPAVDERLEKLEFGHFARVKATYDETFRPAGAGASPLHAAALQQGRARQRQRSLKWRPSSAPSKDVRRQAPATCAQRRKPLGGGRSARPPHRSPLRQRQPDTVQRDAFAHAMSVQIVAAAPKKFSLWTSTYRRAASRRRTRGSGARPTPAPVSLSCRARRARRATVAGVTGGGRRRGQASASRRRGLPPILRSAGSDATPPAGHVGLCLSRAGVRAVVGAIVLSG